MVLSDYIKEVGAAKIAELAEVSESAVYQWATGETAPRPLNAHNIISKSNGVITWTEIYFDYLFARDKVKNIKQLELKL